MGRGAEADGHETLLKRLHQHAEARLNQLKSTEVNPKHG